MPDFFYVDTANVLQALSDLSEKDAPFVTAYALTQTAKDIQAAERASMGSVFDRPTNWTLNSLYVKPATKTDLNAVVYFKNDAGSVPAWKYLGPEVEGGERGHKSFEKRLIRAGLMHDDEYAVPGKGISLDANGNIPGSTLERILSQLGAAEQFAGYQANATKRSLKRKGASVGRYFVLRPDGGGNQARAVAAGIYYRAGVREIVPVLLFVDSPRYRKRFPFHEVAQQMIDSGRLLMRAREGFQKYVVDRAKKA